MQVLDQRPGTRRNKAAGGQNGVERYVFATPTRKQSNEMVGGNGILRIEFTLVGDSAPFDGPSLRDIRVIDDSPPIDADFKRLCVCSGM